MNRLTRGGDRTFWTTALLVLSVVVLALAWSVVQLVSHVSPGQNLATFVPFALFLLPVLYGSINLGIKGGQIVAATAVLMAVPWMVAAIVSGNYVALWAYALEVAALCAVAYFVGTSVTAERAARAEAERSRHAHELLEAQFRDLFENSAAPILLVDKDGSVSEANRAAADVLGRSRDELVGTPIAALIGQPLGAGASADGGDSTDAGGRAPIALGTGGGGRYRVTVAPLPAIDGTEVRQVMLIDVSRETQDLDRLEQYAASVLDGRESERRRIAQELHDGPLQDLIYLGRQIELCRMRLGGAGDAGVEGELAELTERSRSIADEVRVIAKGLRPSQLDELGLAAALRFVCDEFERRAGVAVSLQISGDIPELGDQVELALFRIAQEALSNVHRHAEAATVQVRLSGSGHSVRLELHDDGRGFSPDGAPGGGDAALGMAGIRERAKLVGGVLTVTSAPGAGTSVVVEIGHVGARSGG